jgi:hypothetical protein
VDKIGTAWASGRTDPSQRSCYDSPRCVQGGSNERPVNRREVNKLALHWLIQAKEGANEDQPYVVQRAQWGLQNEKIDLPEPLTPSQPRPEPLEQLVASLLLEREAKPAARVMRFLYSNPNLSPAEQAENLSAALRQAQSPEKAAAEVVEHIYDLMVATSPYRRPTCRKSKSPDRPSPSEARRDPTNAPTNPSFLGARSARA